MATRLETAIARVIAEGKVRTYDMSGRRGDTDSPWRGRQRLNARCRQSDRRLRQLMVNPRQFIRSYCTDLADSCRRSRVCAYLVVKRQRRLSERQN
jgi:hypothetical protein